MAPGPTRRSSRLQDRTFWKQVEHDLLYPESGLPSELWVNILEHAVVNADDDDMASASARTIYAVCKKYGARWGPLVRLYSGDGKLVARGAIECLIATAAYSPDKRSTGLLSGSASPVLPDKDLALPFKNTGEGFLSDLSIERIVLRDYHLDPPDRPGDEDLNHLWYYTRLLQAYSAALRHFGFTNAAQRVDSAYIVMDHLWRFDCMRKGGGRQHEDSGFQKWVKLKNMLFNRIELPERDREHFSFYLPFKAINGTTGLLLDYHRGNHENVQLDWYELVERM